MRRYVRARSRRPGLTGIEQLWIAAKSARPLKLNGIKIRLRELGTGLGLSMSMRSGGGTASPMNGSWPAAIPAT
ncbi:hypothetical protein Acsp02_67700 [Actinoplanes sp. NBRC 103695]|nr:hypothetical protein Acsp02_67700 [Actinoplanes sp. NBRC 103695]